MSDFVKGKITGISEVQELNNGAKKLNFQIDTGEEYYNTRSFELYKGAEHLQHIDNFIKYNSVGDEVNVEFNTDVREHNGNWYTSLKLWKCEKVSSDIPKEIQSTTDDSDDLPF